MTNLAARRQAYIPGSPSVQAAVRFFHAGDGVAAFYRRVA